MATRNDDFSSMVNKTFIVVNGLWPLKKTNKIKVLLLVSITKVSLEQSEH